MKLIFWLFIGFIGYRFWYVPRQLKEAKKMKEEELPQEPDSGDFTDYEEVDDAPSV